MSAPLFANYIGGRWVESGLRFENRNPANPDELIGWFSKGRPEDMACAAEAAGRAFPGWAGLTGPARGAYLYRAAEILDSRFEQIATEMTREEGKTLAESKGEVRRSINILRYFAGEGSRLFGIQAPSERERVHAFSVRKPLGVVALVTPWNFPLAIPAWKAAPALVCGNTVVLKPASAAPLCAWRMVEALAEAGIPEGVINFVAGSGGELGEALLSAPQVKAVSFTGSCQVGNRLHQEASRRRLRIQLEMGGKNPAVVLADADLDSAVETTVNGAFFATGQRCTATSRAIVEAPIYDRFLDALIARTRKLRVGNGLEPGVDVGPVVDAAQLDTVLRYVEIARGEGARLAFGGRRLTNGPLEKGYFVEPTIFADVTEEMTIAREEIFGPVLAVMRAKDYEDAVRMANSTSFGLSASIQTSSLSRAFDFIQRSETGLVMVNLPSAGIDYPMPFGGTKDSSFGPKEQGPAAIEFYTDLKTVYVKY